MTLTDIVLRPSLKLQDRVESRQARFLSALLLGRAVGLLVVTVFVGMADLPALGPAAQALNLAMFLNIFAYALSRSAYYRFAAYLVIAETLISVPLVAYRAPIVEVFMSAPYWMALVPMMSAAVLNIRSTLIVTILGAISFAVMSSIIPDGHLPGLGAAFVFFSIAALLAGAASTLYRE